MQVGENSRWGSAPFWCASDAVWFCSHRTRKDEQDTQGVNRTRKDELPSLMKRCVSLEKQTCFAQELSMNSTSSSLMKRCVGYFYFCVSSFALVAFRLSFPRFGAWVPVICWRKTQTWFMKRESKQRLNPKFLIQQLETLPIELIGTHYLRPIWYPYLSNNFHISNILIHTFSHTHISKNYKNLISNYSTKYNTVL